MTSSDLDKGLKIAVLDIESTGLEAQDGYMLCACVRTVNRNPWWSKTKTFDIRDYDSYTTEKGHNDRDCVKDLIAYLDSFDVIVTWYGSRFDLPFINTRALGHGLQPPRREYRRDLCFVARGVGKLKNNRLATWGRYLFGKSGKTFLPWSCWQRAMRGDNKAIGEIVTHCKADVIETEKIYRKFLPLLGKLKRG